MKNWLRSEDVRAVLIGVLRIYDGRESAFKPMPADAPQDAGCEVPEILGHCRMPGDHPRGCRVVDRVLGKNERSVGRGSRSPPN